MEDNLFSHIYVKHHSMHNNVGCLGQERSKGREVRERKAWLVKVKEGNTFYCTHWHL